MPYITRQDDISVLPLSSNIVLQTRHASDENLENIFSKS